MLNGVVPRRRSAPTGSATACVEAAPSVRTTAATKADAECQATTGSRPRRRAARSASVDRFDMDLLLLVAGAARDARDVFEPGLGVRLAEGDQAFGVIRNEQQEAQEVGFRGAARSEAAGQ